MISFKERAAKLKTEITAVYYAYKDPRTGVLPKLIILITIGYALSPIDFIPDFIPILGYLDDLIILPALITLSVKLIPKSVMTCARIRATEEPVILKKNWLAAAFIITSWVLLILFVIWFIQS
ncbi:MAG TPA: hypothetical protein DCO79_02270 [Spirochaeta sp.]|nr:hypothetical protein [Spirochaeta sp.]